MKNNPSTAAVAVLASLALWAVIITIAVFVYRTYLRDRIDTVPVLGGIHRAIADIRERGRVERDRRNALAQQRQAGTAQWAAAQTQFAATGYPPQAYSVPVPNGQQPVYEYPPVPPQQPQPDFDGYVRQEVNLTQEQLAATIERARAAGYHVEAQADGTLFVSEQSHSVPVQPTPQPVVDDLDDLFDRKLDES